MKVKYTGELYIGQDGGKLFSLSKGDIYEGSEEFCKRVLEDFPFFFELVEDKKKEKK